MSRLKDSQDLERWCDEIDASIFSGDFLFVPKLRGRLKHYVERWGRAIKKHEENPEFIDEESDDEDFAPHESAHD